MAVVLACTCAATPKPTPVPLPAPPTARATPSPERDCGAGHLPRITEQSFGGNDFGAFLAAASKGTVAVDWDGRRARVIGECHLDGRYAGAKGTGDWRFRATNRVIFRTDEITGACRTATHLMAAYLTRASPPTQMKAILVPLPCPPAADSTPASGCIARGLTGPARRAQAEQITAKTAPLDMRTADVATALTVFALLPDEDGGITSAGNLQGDCALIGQGQWLGSQYSMTSSDRPDQPAVVRLDDVHVRRQPPKLNWHGSMDYYNCADSPVFLQCFPGQFTPTFFGPGIWEPTDPRELP